MAEVVAVGPDSNVRTRFSIADGESVRLGRAPREGWKVPWERRISREHADLRLDGDRLTVQCLDTARNPLVFNNVSSREISLSVGEKFRIGRTSFLLVEDESLSVSRDPSAEYAYRRDDLAGVAFGHSDQRLEILSLLPEVIQETRTDEALATSMVGILLDAIPKAKATAAVYYDDPTNIEKGRPAMMRWQSRGDDVGWFRPSRRLMAKAVGSGETVLHFWMESSESEGEFTRCATFDWAFCTPVAAEDRGGWCLYVSGEGGGSGGAGFVTPDDLRGDVRFVELAGRFIAAVHQVRALERQQSQMKSFFSPAVIDTITDGSAETILQPKEGQIAVLFCDVRGFSRKAERAQHKLHDLLNRVSDALGVMTRAIMKHGGVIADFQGDAALAFWGWPTELKEGPLPACRAALAMRDEFQAANRDRNHPLAGFQVGIGIGYGTAIAGQIGTKEQSKVGVFGPVVNLASRLEGMTKQFRVSILVDEATEKYVRECLPKSEGRCRRFVPVRPKGMKAAVTVSELLPPEGHPGTISDQQIGEYEAAVARFLQGEWKDASEALDRLPVGDRAKDLLLIYMAQNDYSPPEDWDGVVKLTSK